MFGLGAVFWLLMIGWLVFGAIGVRSSPGPVPWSYWAGGLLIFILFFLLGWKLFGFPVSGQ